MSIKPRKGRISLEELETLAFEYAMECANASKEVPTARGAVEIKSTKVPSIEYFLNYWIPIKKKFDSSLHRSTWYKWIKSDDEEKRDTIKAIDILFNAMLVDCVLNNPSSGSIFGAKNKLKWTDKTEIDNTHRHIEQPFFPIDKEGETE